MKTKYLYILFLLLTTLSVRSADKECIWVHLKDGSRVAFPFTNKPTITFNGTTMCIATELFEVTNVKKYTFGTLTDVGTVTDNKQQHVYFKDNTLYITSDQATPIVCYTVDGKLLDIRKKRLNEHTVTIDLHEVPTSVIILTVGKESIKISKP